jgi:hypothetical protein
VRLPGISIVGLALGLLASPADAQRSFEEIVVPLLQYKTADTRVLAEAYHGELRLLYDDLRRCAPELDFNTPGIGFRKPRGKPQLAPHLSIWMIADQSVGPNGGNLATRAADAFQRYGSRLFGRLLARDSVRSDPRLGGYGLVLTWTWTPPEEDQRGETMVVFVDGASAAGFVGGSLGATALLNHADIRLFEGDIERTDVRVPVDDAQVKRDSEDCPGPPS